VSGKRFAGDRERPVAAAGKRGTPGGFRLRVPAGRGNRWSRRGAAATNSRRRLQAALRELG